MTNTRCLGVVSVIAAAAACTGQEGPDYPGTPLAVIHGRVQSDVPVSGPLEVSLWWLPDFGPDGKDVGPLVVQRVEVSNQVAGAFTLALFAPPPADSYRSEPDPERGWPGLSHATIMVGRPGRSVGDPVVAGDVVGFAKHQIWYLHGDIVDGTHAAESIGGPLSAGHHVATLCTSESATSGETRPCYRLAPDDLDTVVVVQLVVQ